MERLTKRYVGGQAYVSLNQVSVMGENECVGLPITKLARYEDLEEQGKMLKPKCVPGDYVWEINAERGTISEYEVVSIRYGINKSFHYMWTLRNGIYGDLEGFFDKDIDKTVFFTREQAEEALKRDSAGLNKREGGIRK